MAQFKWTIFLMFFWFLTGFGLKCVEVSYIIISKMTRVFFDIEFAFRELETYTLKNFQTDLVGLVKSCQT